MSDPALEEYLAAAHTIVRRAADLLQATFGDVTATRKVDGSLVTEADRRADAAIIDALTRQFPDHAILSEEGQTSYDPSFEYTWVIDPLDGTTNFARGLPLWGISVALLRHGAPVVGLLSFPMLGLEYRAIHEVGAWRNERPLATDAMLTPDDQHFIMCCTRTAKHYRVTTPLKTRILGSATYHIAAVAEGSAVAGIEATPKLWDVAAALLILTEADGTYQPLRQQGPLFPLEPKSKDFRTRSMPILTACNQNLRDIVRAQIEPNR